jgi:ATP/maltotriose-dependent transcriptional regulator MalT
VSLRRFLDVVAATGVRYSAVEAAEVLWLADHLPTPEGPGAEEVTPPRPDARPAPPPARAPEPPPTGTPAAAPAPSPEVPVHVPAGVPDDPRAAVARPVRLPTVGGLPNPLALLRALRPLKRRVPADHRWELDEDATVTRVAQQDLWVPVLRPALDRWLDLALVVDGGPAGRLWHDLAGDLYRVLQQLAAFRDVRLLHLSTDGAGEPRLTSAAGPAAGLRSPAELIDPRGRRLILVLTDCVGPVWRTPAMDAVLERWARNGPVALLQPLPQYLWRQTGRRPVPGRLRSSVPGAANSRYVPDRRPVPVPLLQIDPLWLRPWAGLVRAADAGGFDAVVTEVGGPVPRPVPAAPDPIEAAERVARFRANASVEAYQLLCYLAAAPLNLSVMRIVQAAMLPAAPPSVLAEAFYSGLLVPAPDQPADEEPLYEFRPGIRETLLTSLRRQDASRILDDVSTYLDSAHPVGDRRTGRGVVAAVPAPAGSAGLVGVRGSFALVQEHLLPRLAGTGTSVAEPVCPDCRRPTGPDDRFCGACGAALPPALRPAAATEERRRITMLVFSLSGHIDTADYAAAHHLVLRHGGIIEKVIPGALMAAVFGVPDATENNALRCVRAGLELLRLFREPLLFGDAPRIGVATGEALVDEVAARAGGRAIVASEVLSTATGLATIALSGGLYLDEPTYDEVRDRVECVEQDRVTLRGRAQAIRVWLARPAPPAGRPFVGREAEFNLLARLLAGVREGKPALAMVGGPAGIGKSRLLREFADWARASGAYVLWGTCVPLGANAVPHAPLVEALRAMVRERGEAEVLRLGGADYTEFADQISNAGTVRLFGTVRRLLRRISKDAPVLVVLEDLQWADPSTVDLLAYLARAMTNERLLLIGSYRPGGTALASLLTGQVVRIELPPLTRPDLAAILAASSGDPVAPELVDWYYELSEGNPFFAEELMAAGLSTDPAVPLPPSLRETLLARLERSGPDAIHVAQVAATAGRPVGHRLLTAVCGLPEPVLVQALRDSVDAAVLVADGDAYTFRHALLREVVYQSLLPVERARLHRSIAEALSADPGLSLAGEDAVAVAAEVADYWFLTGLLPQALAAAVRAGDLAVRMRAFPEAVRQYGRALEIWPRVADPAPASGVPHHRLLAVAADAARWDGDARRAVELVTAALDEVDATADPERAGELYERLGTYRWEAGDAIGSYQAFHSAVALLAGRPPTAATARAFAALSDAAIQAGRYTEALRYGERAVDQARAAGSRAEIGRALNAAGSALAVLGRTDAGIASLREALQIATELDQLEDVCRVCGNLAAALEHAGRLDESVEVAREGLDRARRGGLERAGPVAVLAARAGATLYLLGRWDEAMTILTEAVRDRRVEQTPSPRLTLAAIHVARGGFEAAGELLAGVWEGGLANADPRLVGPLYTCRAELALWQGDRATARTEVDIALAVLDAAEDTLVLSRLYAMGLRIVADECAPDGPDTGRAAAVAYADELLTRVRNAAVVATPPMAEIGVLMRLCVAERARIDGTDTALMWEAVAVGWESLRQPYPAGYARWRAGQAALAAGDRRPALQALRSAHTTAVALSAEPLRAHVEATARAGRLDLDEPRPVPDRFGLTRRELQVLGELSGGRTNQQIARELSIPERTVAVHVAGILRKLGVVNRVQATAIAQRNGLLDEPSA